MWLAHSNVNWLCILKAFGEPHHDIQNKWNTVCIRFCIITVLTVSLYLIYTAAPVSTRASPSQHCSAVWPQHFQPQCYKSWQCQCHALCVWHPFTVQCSTSCTSHVMCLDQNIARPEEGEAEKKTKQLTFRWPLQFPSPSLLARRQQAVVLVFLRVLLFPAGQESVLLGPAPALTLGAVLCPAGGRVSGDPVLHFPLLLFGEAGIGRPVSVPAHVSIVDLCHGRPTHPCVAVAHTHTAFERATALDLRAREEGETLTSSQSVSFRDDYCCSRSRGCFEGVWHITGIYCRWLSNKQNLPGVTTNHPACLKKSKAGGIIRVRINPP